MGRRARETGEPLCAGLEGGVSGSYAWERHAEDDDFARAGALYRLMPADAKARLVENLAASLAAVSREDVAARSIGHFCAADPRYGARVEAALKEKRGQPRAGRLSCAPCRSRGTAWP